jgi:CarD family transcriptional regulator
MSSVIQHLTSDFSFAAACTERLTKQAVYVIVVLMSEDVKQYAVGEKVVYPSQGVGLIKEIVEREFKNEKVTYYNIYLEVTDMTVMVPVEKAGGLGIRPIVKPDEAWKALELMGEEGEPNPTDWKMRYQMNLDLLRKGTVLDIAAIVRSLYNRSKVKELPIMERKLYDSALKLFQDELSFALGKSKEEIETMIHGKLEG